MKWNILENLPCPLFAVWWNIPPRTHTLPLGKAKNIWSVFGKMRPQFYAHFSGNKVPLNKIWFVCQSLIWKWILNIHGSVLCGRLQRGPRGHSLRTSLSSPLWVWLRIWLSVVFGICVDSRNRTTWRWGAICKCVQHCTVKGFKKVIQGCLFLFWKENQRTELLNI